MNHIIDMHYNTAYGCGKCLNVVSTSGQQLKTHIKTCMGFPKDDTTSSSNKEPMLPGAQDSLCRTSKHSKEAKSDSAKESSSHTKESSSHKGHRKSHEKPMDWDDPSAKDKHDKNHSKSDKSCKK